MVSQEAAPQLDFVFSVVRLQKRFHVIEATLILVDLIYRFEKHALQRRLDVGLLLFHGHFLFPFLHLLELFCGYVLSVSI